MKRLVLALDSFNRCLYKAQKLILFVAVGAMVVINGAQIAGRYIFQYSLPWSEQVSIVLFTLLIMFGGNLAIKQNSEIRLTLFRWKNRKIKNTLEWIGDIVTVGTLALLICSSWWLVEQAARRAKLVSSIQLNYKYIYAVVLAGFLLILFEKLLAMLKRLAGIDAGIAEGMVDE